MKILCDHKQLQDAFGIVAGIAPLKTPKPIIQHVLLNADDEGLTLFATDLEMSARVRLDSVKVAEAGSALLPARETSALLREINDPTVSLHSEEFRCTLESGGGSFVLLGDDPGQFPAEVDPTDGSSLEIPAGRFLEMIRQTTFSAAREETRYAINGVLIDCADDCVNLVATDGRRLSLTYEHVDGDVPEVKVVVPLRALSALGRAIPEDSKETIGIRFSGNQIAFSFGRTELVAQLLESRFPEYSAVIPKAAETSVDMPRELLMSKLRQVAVLSSGDVRMVSFKFSSSSLELSAESSGVGRADVVMEVDVKGAGGTVSFNPDYLLDALKVSELETVHLDMCDDSTPAKFALGEAFTYVLMPISGS